MARGVGKRQKQLPAQKSCAEEPLQRASLERNALEKIHKPKLPEEESRITRSQPQFLRLPSRERLYQGLRLFICLGIAKLFIARIPFCMNALEYLSELIGSMGRNVNETDMFLVQSVVTCGALFWLLHRAWLTLWKPVPELIGILGVEVPEPPEVSLAGIKADAVTLHWLRPGPNKPVINYLIQVNGVIVGESSKLETAITVMGLKPGHFYNVRVIAVGNNSFQAGSRVIRLRTYSRDGRPELGNGRLPTNLSIEDLQNGAVVDSSDESAGIRSHAVGVATAAVAEGSQAMARDHSNSHSGQRRNTVGRRHSPSTASDHPVPPLPNGKDADATMQQLTERFENIRSETEEIMAQMAKDTEDSRQQMADLLKERDEKRQILKEKEEASEKLKKEVNTSERSNRQAQNRKSQKQKALRDKLAEKTKMKGDMTSWEREIQEMKKEKESWQKEREKIGKSTKKKVEELKDILRKRQNSLNSMEEEIRVKGLKIKELEVERQKLSGVEDDEESKERDAAEKLRDMQWDQKERELISRINSQSLIARNLGGDLQKANAFLTQLSARQATNTLMYHGNSSGVDFDPNGQGRVKPRRSRQRKSRTNTVSSPVTAYPITDSTFPGASAYINMVATTSPTFAAGPYFDMNATTGMSIPSDTSGMSEADRRFLQAGAPLSPTAAALLPANIFADDESVSSLAEPARTVGPSLFPNIGMSMYDNGQQSPGSSSRSASQISSPQTSSNNLQIFPSVRESANEGDRRRSINSPGGEFGIIGQPSTSSIQPASGRRFGDLFNLRQRGKTMDEGPPLGKLKSGQSQSFPRQTDESESLVTRNRRTSFSTSWSTLQFLNRNVPGNELVEGNAPAPARNVARRRRPFGPFGSNDGPVSVYSERDPSSPRPASIASSDLPRPSTDSGAFGWAAADPSAVNKNSPLATNWSLNVTHPWSRNSSRKPSIQQGSTSALSIGIAAADDDDEFLPPESIQSSPPPVGVIGMRPQSSKSATPRLNPAAPTFKAMFSRSKSDKDKVEKSEKSKSKKIKDGIDSPDEPTIPASQDPPMSPTESRKSRDTRSIHTSASITESHESLTLDKSISNTTSEMAILSSKESKENSFQKLLRKGSSSKFSISSFRGKESSLFGAKKGGNPSSDRNASGDRSSSFGDMDESGEEMIGRNNDSVTSSPQIGTPRDGRMSVNWGRFPFKKGKGVRSSIEAEAGEREKERASETEGTEDDERDDS